MAVRQISTTATLEQYRQEFNAMTLNDFGDIATLDPSLTATTVIGAVNELSSAVSSGQAFFIEDITSTVQQVAAGQTLRFRGTNNQLNAIVSVPDTLTISLANDVTIPNDLTVTNQVSAVSGVIGSTMTIGTGSIVDSSGQISFGNDNLTTTGDISGATVNASSLVSTGAVSGTSGSFSGSISGTDLSINENIVFEGATPDGFETTLTTTDPIADATITIPNTTGTMVTTGDTGSVTSTMILNNTILNEDIANSTIRAAKLNLSTDTLVVDTLQANAITGTASIAQLISLTDAANANASYFLTFADGATGNQALETDAGITYNPSTNVLSTTASQAQYADLAEYYTSDKSYEAGTVVMFGGEKEVTIGERATPKVAGVVSSQPAYQMNAKLVDSGETCVAVALQGRVPCKVIGYVEKGDMMIAGNDGFAISSKSPALGTVIGKALEDYKGEGEGVIEVVVGRL